MVYSSDWYSGKCNRNENVPSFLRRVWYLIEDVEQYNPNKLDNPCNSVQEFIEMKKEEICKYWGRGVLDLSMEVLHYYARLNPFSLAYALANTTSSSLVKIGMFTRSVNFDANPLSFTSTFSIFPTYI